MIQLMHFKAGNLYKVIVGAAPLYATANSTVPHVFLKSGEIVISLTTSVTEFQNGTSFVRVLSPAGPGVILSAFLDPVS